MSLLDYINNDTIKKQTKTYLWIYCPVCLGDLGISKKTGAYKCWSNNCDTRKIWSDLTRESYNPKPIKIEYPIKIIDKPKRLSFISIKGYKPGISNSYLSNRYAEKVKETTYIYNSKCKVVRYDLLDSGKKIFNPMFYDLHKWIIGKGDIDWSFYNEPLIQLKGNIIIAAEGEKSAEAICEVGYACLSAPGFASESWLEASFRRIYPWIDGVLYWADKDEPGQSKGSKFQNAAWKANLWCDIISHPSVNDAADLIPEERLKYLKSKLDNLET